MSSSSFKPLHYVYYPDGDGSPEARRSRVELVFEPKVNLQGEQWRKMGGGHVFSDAEMLEIKKRIERGNGVIYRIVETTRERINAIGELPTPPSRLRENDG
jgi:hypothetical protein